MSNYVILTDSSADLSAEMVAQADVAVLPLSFMIQDQTFQDYPDNRDIDPHTFYEKLRGVELVTTAAVNMGQFMEAMEPFLQEGKDVLVLAFSSGLSSTYAASELAVEELKEQYPDRKLYTVDTLSASLGQGMLVWLAAQQRKAGKSIEEVRDWAEENKLNICHQFTVDDLFFLKRGGRVSSTTAVVGSMLHIKPLLHVDNEGHLINIAKARGRHVALKGLVDKMAENAIDPETQTIFISHGDCLADAQIVADMVKERFGVKDVLMNFVGPVIGAHAGPGVVALFYYGSAR